jgi:Fuc2NAc and GlcNAc transferase
MLAHALPGLITAAVASFVVTALVAVWGPVDRPDRRRNHQAPTPTSAGLGIILGTCLGLAVLGLAVPGLTLLLALAAGTGLFGALDDVLDLGPRIKLALQVLFALAFAVFGAHIDALPLAPGLSLNLGPILGVLGTTLWIVVVVNAFNFIDGSNGLSPGAAIIVLLGQAGLGLGLGHSQPGLGLAALICAAAGLGFLPWNLPGGRVFQGDAGALFSGFMVAGLAVLASTGPAQPGLSPYPVVMACLPLLTDVLLTLLKRQRAGKVLWQAHRDHVFQRWLLAHPGHGALALRFWGLTGAYSLAGLAAERAPSGWQAGLLSLGVISAIGLWAWLDRRLSPGPSSSQTADGEIGQGL